ncbi:MAG TPA: Lrp/AsnC ligand binding domain-containing protein [Nitrososphaeraceae archaeon]
MSKQVILVAGCLPQDRWSKLRVGRISYCCCTKLPTTIVISVRFEYSGMPRAFVLVNAELGYETTLADEMKGIAGVSNAYTIYGVYDILLKVEAPTMDKLKEFISTRIRRMRGVKSTLTMLIMED